MKTKAVEREAKILDDIIKTEQLSIDYAPLIYDKTKNNDNIHILGLVPIFTCPFCHSIGRVGEDGLFARCETHLCVCQEDYLILYTTTPHKTATYRKKGWIRRNGSEVRTGRYGLVQKDGEYEYMENEFWLNREPRSWLLEQDCEIYGIVLSELLLALSDS